MKNVFIVIEGIDGAGTTTQSILLAKKIFENFKQYKILLTREPTGGKYGLKIRKILSELNKSESRREKLLELFIQDRKEHLRSFENFAGIVISDRHKHSTFAYQPAQGVEFNQVYTRHQGLRPPDITLIIDLPVRTAMARSNTKLKREFFDTDKKFLEKVRKNYLSLPRRLAKEKIVVVNGAGSKEQVAGRIWQTVKYMIK